RNRTTGREARGGDCAAQPPSPPEIAARYGGGGDAEEYPDDRTDGRRQNGAGEATGEAGELSFYQSRGEQVHGSRLRGAGCRIDDPGSGGHRHRHGARAEARRGGGAGGSERGKSNSGSADAGGRGRERHRQRKDTREIARTSSTGEARRAHG